MSAQFDSHKDNELNNPSNTARERLSQITSDNFDYNTLHKMLFAAPIDIQLLTINNFDLQKLYNIAINQHSLESSHNIRDAAISVITNKLIKNYNMTFVTKESALETLETVITNYSNRSTSKIYQQPESVHFQTSPSIEDFLIKLTSLSSEDTMKICYENIEDHSEKNISILLFKILCEKYKNLQQSKIFPVEYNQTSKNVEQLLIKAIENDIVSILNIFTSSEISSLQINILLLWETALDNNSKKSLSALIEHGLSEIKKDNNEYIENSLLFLSIEKGSLNLFEHILSTLSIDKINLINANGENAIEHIKNLISIKKDNSILRNMLDLINQRLD